MFTIREKKIHALFNFIESKPLLHTVRKGYTFPPLNLFLRKIPQNTSGIISDPISPPPQLSKAQDSFVD